jgi:hypothetical protein
MEEEERLAEELAAQGPRSAASRWRRQVLNDDE